MNVGPSTGSKHNNQNKQTPTGHVLWGERAREGIFGPAEAETQTKAMERLAGDWESSQRHTVRG